MKVRWFWEGLSRPYMRACDELCNTTFTFAIPFIGGVTFYRQTRKFSDGYWYTVGASDTGFSAVTDDGAGRTSKEAGPPLRDSHGNGRDPRSRKSSLRDAETCEGAVSESMQFINSSGEVVGEIPLPQSGSVTELGNGSTCECCNEIDRLSDAIAVVLELHEPDGDYCGECSIHDAVTYPCPTVVAIRTALGEVGK